jgi:hypothetical protein
MGVVNVSFSFFTIFGKVAMHLKGNYHSPIVVYEPII